MRSTMGIVLVALAGSATSAESVLQSREPPVNPAEVREARGGLPTDPWFDRELVATDEREFVRSAVEAARQGMADTAGVVRGAEYPQLRQLAESIHAHNEATSRRLEQLASVKGWPLPEQNTLRESSVLAGGVGTARANANFILHQIAFHEVTLEKFRAQIEGEGDADLERALRRAVPGYRENLQRLLQLDF